MPTKCTSREIYQQILLLLDSAILSACNAGLLATREISVASYKDDAFHEIIPVIALTTFLDAIIHHLKIADSKFLQATALMHLTIDDCFWNNLCTAIRKDPKDISGIKVLKAIVTILDLSAMINYSHASSEQDLTSNIFMQQLLAVQKPERLPEGVSVANLTTNNMLVNKACYYPTRVIVQTPPKCARLTFSSQQKTLAQKPKVETLYPERMPRSKNAIQRI